MIEARKVGVFVDWNSQLRAINSEIKLTSQEKADIALRKVGKTVVKDLQSLGNNRLYRVRLRLYHGWMKGFTATENRKCVQRSNLFDYPDEIYPSSNVLSLGDVEFGDRLIDALSDRLVPGYGIHLPNTLRIQSYDVIAEKMVDTALAADMLAWAREEPSSVLLVITSDDDMVPPLFVAEAWMRPYGGTVRITRAPSRAHERFLRLEGLTC